MRFSAKSIVTSLLVKTTKNVSLDCADWAQSWVQWFHGFTRLVPLFQLVSVTEFVADGLKFRHKVGWTNYPGQVTAIVDLIGRSESVDHTRCK